MKWFIADGSQSFGPYSSEQLREFAKAGKVNPNNYVRRDDQQEWIEASRVNGLFEGVLTIAPPTPTVAFSTATHGVPPGRAVPHVDTPNRLVAALLALFLGGVGVHLFYLGKIGRGIIYLVFCWTLIPLIVSFIEGLYYLSYSESEWNAYYQAH